MRVALSGRPKEKKRSVRAAADHIVERPPSVTALEPPMVRLEVLQNVTA